MKKKHVLTSDQENILKTLYRCKVTLIDLATVSPHKWDIAILVTAGLVGCDDGVLLGLTEKGYHMLPMDCELCHKWYCNCKSTLTEEEFADTASEARYHRLKARMNGFGSYLRGLSKTPTGVQLLWADYPIEFKNYTYA
jgi:hypothetical protein